MQRPYAVVVLVCVLLAVSAAETFAIPAFARKYNMSCLTCHQPAPRLKDFGDEFAGNAFQLEGKEPARFYRDTGDDWLMLMRELPLALRLEGFVRWLPETEGQTDFETPYNLKILSGGLIAKDIAYYFYFFFSERGEVAGIEDAFIMFNNLFSSDLDVYIGQFQVCDPLFKRELRLMLDDYQIYRVRPGNSHIDLTYDRGLMLTYGFETGTDLTLMVLNGNGIGEADANRMFDTDKYKNLMLRASQDVGETFRVGAFGYYGKEAPMGPVNTVWMAGPDLTLRIGKIELNAQYVERRDSDPLLQGGGEEVATRGTFGELIYLPEADDSRWYLAGLYNWGETVNGGDTGASRYNTLTGHVGYILARNLRLTGEYTYDFTRKANAVTVGFVSAF